MEAMLHRHHQSDSQIVALADGTAVESAQSKTSGSTHQVIAATHRMDTIAHKVCLNEDDVLHGVEDSSKCNETNEFDFPMHDLHADVHLHLARVHDVE